jgi:hypothetical protein
LNLGGNGRCCDGDEKRDPGGGCALPFILGVKRFSVLCPSLMGYTPLPPHAHLFSHMHFYFPLLDFCFSIFRCFSFLNFGSVIKNAHCAWAGGTESQFVVKREFIHYLHNTSSKFNIRVKIL